MRRREAGAAVHGGLELGQSSLLSRLRSGGQTLCPCQPARAPWGRRRWPERTAACPNGSWCPAPLGLCWWPPQAPQPHSIQCLFQKLWLRTCNSLTVVCWRWTDPEPGHVRAVSTGRWAQHTQVTGPHCVPGLWVGTEHLLSSGSGLRRPGRPDALALSNPQN